MVTVCGRYLLLLDGGLVGEVGLRVPAAVVPAVQRTHSEQSPPLLRAANMQWTRAHVARVGQRQQILQLGYTVVVLDVVPLPAI